MLRCASSLVIAAYIDVRLIPQELRALPLELFTKPFIFHQNLLTSNSYKYTDTVIADSGSASEKRLIIMGTEKKYCSICAWRENCTKRFTVSIDSSGYVHCPDYTRDFTIKEKDIYEAEKKSRSES